MMYYLLFVCIPLYDEHLFTSIQLRNICTITYKKQSIQAEVGKMSGLGLARSLQRCSKVQMRGVAFEAAIIAAAAKKVHMTLSSM